MRKRRKFTPFAEMKKQIPVSRSVAIHQLFDANSVQYATTPGSQPAEKTSFVSTNAISERWVWETGMGGGSVEQS